MSSKSQAAAAALTPLSHAVFHILLSLGEGERHGYALKHEISLRTGGKVKLGAGVLYGAINKMLELGRIEESDASSLLPDHALWPQGGASGSSWHARVVAVGHRKGWSA